MPIGYQFQPDEEKRLRQNLNRPGQFSPGVSEAIRILALRLPNVLGGRPMSPDDLLRPAVGGATSLNPVGPNPGMPRLPETTPRPPQPSSPASNPFTTLGPGEDLGPGESGGNVPRPTITPGGGDVPFDPEPPAPPMQGPDQGPVGGVDELLNLFLRRPGAGDWRTL